MSAEIVNLASAAAQRGQAPPSTEREFAASMLSLALHFLDEGQPHGACYYAGLAGKALERLTGEVRTEEDQRRDLEARRKRIMRAQKGKATRRRNKERRAAALAAAGIVLTADGVILPHAPG